jgi:exodeoxyribonuclease (lambda-induced)
MVEFDIKIRNEFQQDSLEWHKCRSGKLTGSDFHTLLGSGETAKKLIAKKAMQRVLTDNQLLQHLSNEENYFKGYDIQRGKDLEAVARIEFEKAYDYSVEEVGFVDIASSNWAGFVGCSPDGLVGEDAILEIKCPREEKYFLTSITEDIDKEYYTQIQFNMLICKRQKCYFVIYNEIFGLNVLVINRDDDYINDKIIPTINLKILEMQKMISKFESKNF